MLSAACFTVMLSVIKAGLHYGNYRSKLVHFETQINIFYVKKSLSLERFSP